MKKETSLNALFENREEFKNLNEWVFKAIEDNPCISTDQLKHGLQIKSETLSARLSQLEDDGRIFASSMKGKYSQWLKTPLDHIEIRRQKVHYKKFTTKLNALVRDYGVTMDMLQPVINHYTNRYLTNIEEI